MRDLSNLEHEYLFHLPEHKLSELSGGLNILTECDKCEMYEIFGGCICDYCPDDDDVL